MDADDLVRAVRAALDERERIAQIVADRYRSPDGTPVWPLPTVRARFRDADPGIAAGLTLIEMFGPAAVLRRVAADRRVLDRHQPRMLPALPYRPAMAECEYCASLCHSRSGLGCDEPIDAPWPCDEILDLADRLGINPEGT